MSVSHDVLRKRYILCDVLKRLNPKYIKKPESISSGNF